ncbi:hypothetical protein FA15DRAFT_705354 [Coprinopsis marcescibilis]|uniref:DUF6533 domain-containing protein n=1 Tax=Coprinopsis marcescibilis TaxID=230819 RepID=A0A5C3KSI0_COPMA|nr:hypothetical protein FA15DRAFT_705354 [Coprinopsis marcescibilis]
MSGGSLAMGQRISQLEVATSLRHGRITKWLDYFETLAKEVDYVWSSPNSIVKALFFLSRYTVPLHLMFNASFNFMLQLSVEVRFTFILPVPRKEGQRCCRVAYEAITGLQPDFQGIITALINASMSEALLYYQVYAFSHKSKLLGIYLLIQYLAVWSSVITVQVKYLSGLGFRTIRLGEAIHCLPLEADRNLMGASFIISVASLIILVIITFVIIHKKYRNFKSALLTSFIRDGMLYFYALVVMDVISAVLIYAGQDTIKWIMATPRTIAYGVLTARMVLHLRAIAQKQAQSGVIGPVSSMTFASPSRRPSIHFNAAQNTAIESFSLSNIPQSPVLGISVSISRIVHVDEEVRAR